MVLQDGASARARTRPEWLERSAGFLVRHRVVLALTALAAAIRFATLTTQSYWLDESQAAHEVTLSFGQMLSAWNRAEWNPPLYLILAWPWAHVFGAGEAGLRSLSAVLGTLLVPVLYLCGAELVSRRAGWVAALFAAVSPFMVDYSQEAREYMLLTLLCAVSLLFYARTVRTDGRRDLTWWAAFSALAVLTQYFAGFLVLAEGIVLIWRLRSRWSVAALVVQGVVLAPFIPHVEPQLRTQAGFIVDQPLLLRVKQVPVTFALDTLYKTGLVEWGLIGAGVAAAVVIALLLAGADDRELRGAGVAAIPAAFVLLAPLVLSLAGHDDYLARGLMPAWPPLAVVFAAACTARRAPTAGAALAVVIVGLSVWAGVRIDLGTGTSLQRSNWRAVAGVLHRTWGGPHARAIAVYPGQFGSGPLSWYLHDTPWDGPGLAPGTDVGPAAISEIDVVANAGTTLGATPPSWREIGRVRDVDGYVVARYVFAPVSVTAGDVRVDADSLVGASGATPAVMFQAPARSVPAPG